MVLYSFGSIIQARNSLQFDLSSSAESLDICIYIFAVGGNERTGQKEQIKYSYYQIKQDAKQVGEGTPYNTSSTGHV